MLKQAYKNVNGKAIWIGRQDKRRHARHLCKMGKIQASHRVGSTTWLRA